MGSMRALPDALSAVLLALGVLASVVAPPRADAQDTSTPPKAEAPADSSAASLAPGRPPDQIMAWQLDRVLIADFDQAAAYEEQLVQCGIPREKLLRLGLRQ